MSIYITATKDGIEVKIARDDYFNTYDSDIIPWHQIAENIYPYLKEMEETPNDR